MRAILVALFTIFTAQAGFANTLSIACEPVNGFDSAGGLNRARIVGTLEVKEQGGVTSVSGPLVITTKMINSGSAATTIEGVVITSQVVSRGRSTKMIVGHDKAISDARVSYVSISNLQTMSAQSVVVVDGIRYLTRCSF